MPLGLSLYDTARIQGRLWTPPASQPAAWFDAADLSTITNTATGVSDWADKSGNGRTMSNASASLRPDLLREKANGNAVVDFNDETSGATDRLQMAATINVRTAYVALNRRNGTIYTSNNFVFTADGGISTGAYDWHGPHNSTSSIFADSGNANANWRNGSNFCNGSAITITASGSAILNAMAVYSFLCLGNMVTQGIGYDRVYHGSIGGYGEVLWYSGAHSTRDRLLIEGYLAWKWGVTLVADHPFATRPPLLGD